MLRSSWLAAAGLFVLSTSCGGAGTPGSSSSVKVAKSVPAPWSPVGAGLPASNTPPLPPLDGRKDGVDLEKLARVYTTFTLNEMSLGGIGAISTEQLPGLRSHLAASSKWRLTRWEGADIAFRREAPEGDQARPVVGWGGYVELDDGQVLRQGLRLEPWREGAPEAEAEMVVRVGHDEDVIKLSAWSLQGAEYGGWQAVGLSVQGPAVAMEVHELSDKLELDGTISAVSKTPPFLATASRMIRPAEVVPGKPVMLPRGEPQSGDATVRLRHDDGVLDISGRLNPGADGWTWIRVLSKQGEPWNEQLVAQLSMEAVGWNSDQNGLFYYQGQVPSAEPPPPGGVVQAWFAADKEATPTLLGQWRIDPSA